MKKAPTPAQEAWPQKQFVSMLTQLAIPLLAVLLYACMQLILVGEQNNHYVFMVVGSILSFVGAFIYVIASYTHGATGKRSIFGMLSAFAGFIPYLFGCYLVFYQGFWGFTELSSGFSVWVVIKGMVAILLGYKIVNAIYQITELDKSVKPNLGGPMQANKLDSLLATHDSFESALVVRSPEEQLAFIDANDPGQILSVINSEYMKHKGKKYEVLHFRNSATGQERSLYFDVTKIPNN
jgi:uncharacterized membrane protein YozB (DUF420 family)